MKQVSEMPMVRDLPKTDPLCKSKFWNKPVDQVTPHQLLVFVKRMDMNGWGERAKDNVYTLLEAIRKEIATGELESAMSEKFNLPEKSLCIEEIRQQLRTLTKDQIDAVTFCIASSLTLNQVALLEWKDVKNVTLDNRTREMINKRPRNLETDLVFWEYEGGELIPMMDIKRQFYMASEKTIEYYRAVLEDSERSISEADRWLMKAAFWKAIS